MDITGKIIVLEDEVQVSAKFKKRDFVIEYATNPQYPEFVKFEVVQDKCDMLNQFKVGQEAQVFFDVCGRKWTNPQGVTKYFNSLKAWRITLVLGAAQEVPASAVQDEQGAKIEDPEISYPF